jgi:hypothetical protein
MSNNKLIYSTREFIVNKYKSDEKALCEEYFSKIFKTSRKVDKNGDLRVDFEVLSNGLFNDNIEDNVQFKNMLNRLVEQQELTDENQNHEEKGLSYKEFYNIVSENFIPSIMNSNGKVNKTIEENLDLELDFMFDDLKGQNGFIGVLQIENLLHNIRDGFHLTKLSKDQLRELVLSASKDERGMNLQEFKVLMKSEQF